MGKSEQEQIREDFERELGFTLEEARKTQGELRTLKKAIGLLIEGKLLNEKKLQEAVNFVETFFPNK